MALSRKSNQSTSNGRLAASDGLSPAGERRDPRRVFLHELGNVFSSILALGATIRIETPELVNKTPHIDAMCELARRGLRAMDRFSEAIDGDDGSNGHPAQSSNQNLPTGTGTVLVVEDEVIVRDAAIALLSRLGYQTLAAADRDSAVEIYRANRATVDLVLLDMNLPDATGRSCFRDLREIDRGVRVLLVAGEPKQRQTEELLLKGALGIVGKPFEIGGLAYAVEQALSAHIELE